MQILLVILSLVLLIYLCFKGVPIFFGAMISGIFLLITAGMNPVEQITTTYVTGLANYFGKFFFIFVLGSLFGKLTDISGAADAVAKVVIDKLGDRFIVPSIMLAGVILTYGGVSVFVCMFTLYPLMVSLFKKGDISRTLIPASYRCRYLHRYDAGFSADPEPDAGSDPRHSGHCSFRSGHDRSSF